MSENKAWVKHMGRSLVGVMLFNALSPLSVLAREPGQLTPAAQAQLRQMGALQAQIEAAKLEKSRSPAERIDEDLRQAQDALDTLRDDARARGTVAKEAVRADRRAVKRVELRALAEPQRAEHRRVLKERLAAARAGQDLVQAEFEQTGAELRSKRLPAEILARHEQAMQAFKARRAEFEKLHKAWEADPSDAKMAALAEFFDRNPAKRKLSPKDPKKLPWSTPEPTQRKPAETKTAWFQNLWGDKQTRLAQAGGSIGGINFDIPPEAGTAPAEADLSETPETQRSAAIVAKAVELGNNALAIHNWVRNSIEWVPTWGAIQSAQDTLDKKRGNAHDIASLEIALLRAAKIPARYQYGTIELSAEQVQNWVGGVNTPSAAQQLLGQGGVASVAMVAGGKVAAIRMEHVWVDAYVNWAPSRGAKQGSASQHVNPVGPHNAWVSLDPSYKQYSYAPGMDLKTAVPLDANALLDAAKQGATVNEAEGWVQNLNQAAIQSQLADYQSRLASYVQAQNANATVGDVIGKKIVVQQLPSLLAATLPYKTVQLGQQVAAVPGSLQHKFTYRLYASDYDRMLESPFLTYTEKVSQLVGKRLTLTYVPATQADVDAIVSYIPKAHADGSPVQPSEFPTSLPAYLIRLKPQIKLDGVVVATSSDTFTMGTELLSDGGFTVLGDASQWDITSEESNTVGNATAIGVNAGGVNAVQLRALQQRMASVKAAVESGDAAALGSYAAEQISGDLLQATIWTWFLAAESHSKFSQRASNMVEYPGLSYGLFHAATQPVYSWGVVRSVRFPGVNFDIGHVRHLGWSTNDSRAEWSSFNRKFGQHLSALEHVVPERLFNDPTKCNSPDAASPISGLPACSPGVSAVQALGAALSAGQKIYTITPSAYQANPNIVQAAMSGQTAATRNAVSNALAAGQEVTFHERPVTIGKWVGAGYIALDPDTGAGGYMIEGGSNGGFLDYWGNNGTYIGLALAFASLLAAVFTVAPILVVILAILSIFVSFMNILVMELQATEGGCPAMGDMGAALELVAFVSAFFGAAGVAIGTWISFLTGGAVGAAAPACRR